MKIVLVLFTVSLFLWGCKKEAEAVAVTEVASPVALSAGFTTENDLKPTEGLPCKFINKSAGAVSYYWDFGDGNFSVEKDPVFIFEGCGNHPVSLTATGAKGNQQMLSVEQEVKCGGKHAPQNP